MRTIAEGASVAGENTARIWQKGATRRAILVAARLVAARTGSTDFSLNTVAKEAGYSTTTVFAYFPTKNDLFIGIVADDLAVLARTMREGYFFSEAEKDPVENVVPEPEPEVAVPVRESVPEEIPEASSVVAFAPPSEAKTEVSRTSEPPRVDAWLERRLRVFEKTLADIETRLTAVQRESSASASNVEENTKIFGARLETSEKRIADLSSDLSTRMSAAEKRLKDAQGELRNSLLTASMRIDQLEAAAKRVAGDAGYTPSVEFAPDTEQAEAAQPGLVDKPFTAATDTYLSAARRAAQTAAVLADMEQKKNRRKTDWWLNKRTITFAYGMAVFFVLGAFVSYAVGEHVGRSTPIRIIVPASFGTHRDVPVKTAEITPLDRVSDLANRGNAKAELLVGLRYHKGNGVPADQREAVKWISKAAATQDPVAQFWLAELYRHGDGVPTDASLALRWDEAAAAQGNCQAMHDLGVAYAEGMGTGKDFVRSAHWFEQAAQRGLVNSQFNLAVLYERGEGVSQSLLEAYKWYGIAAAHGDAESKARVEAIAAQLPPEKLAVAKIDVASFKPDAADPKANVLPTIGALALSQSF